MTKLWKIAFAVVAISLLVSSVFFYRFETASALKRTPQQGYLSSGAEISTAELVSQPHFLPPPPLDAQPFEIRFPLRNGKNVPVKKRWVWVPPGQSISFKLDSSGTYQAHFPVGTKLWKDFYLESSAGVFLVERRMTVKVDEQESSNGGWVFLTSHTMPETSWTYNDLFPWNLKVVTLENENSKQMFFKPDDWLPVQDRFASTHLELKGKSAPQSNYVFPGMKNCSYCHNGAAAAFSQNESSPKVLAFGIHPDNLTESSWQQLLKSNTVTFDTLSSNLNEQDELTREFLGVMRNNCLTCHNSVKSAAASHTSFRLDPNKNYTKEELLKEFSQMSGRFGSLGHTLVTPGDPERSEIILRMKGVAGRLRMPPPDGGVPDEDTEFIALVEKWILSTSQNY